VAEDAEDVELRSLVVVPAEAVVPVLLAEAAEIK
jgi:hypothetical protein